MTDPFNRSLFLNQGLTQWFVQQQCTIYTTKQFWIQNVFIGGLFCQRFSFLSRILQSWEPEPLNVVDCGGASTQTNSQCPQSISCDVRLMSPATFLMSPLDTFCKRGSSLNKNQVEPGYKGHPIEFMVYYFRPFRTIWDHLGPFKTILNLLGPFYT